MSEDNKIETEQKVEETQHSVNTTNDIIPKEIEESKNETLVIQSKEQKVEENKCDHNQNALKPKRKSFFKKIKNWFKNKSTPKENVMKDKSQTLEPEQSVEQTEDISEKKQIKTESINNIDIEQESKIQENQHTSEEKNEIQNSQTTNEQHIQDTAQQI